jgi:origin recognition complex subunit 2
MNTADASSDENDEFAQTANRSARRKSTRNLIERSLANPLSEESDDDDEELLAVDILGAENSSLDEETSQNGEIDTTQTPSKTRHRRTKKQKTKTREPQSPPRHLPPHERYFWDNRSGATKTSDKILPPNLLLNHDDYFAKRDSWTDPHQDPRDFLLELHQKAFHQWAFELRNDFNICLYGYGSKRAALASFAHYIHEEHESTPIIVIVNGFRPDITSLDILLTIASTLLPPHVKLPSVPNTLLTLLLETLDARPPSSPLHLLINSIDASSLRRGSNTQSALASLAAHPSVRLVATSDTPNFLQLWDASLRTRFRFLFHDCTTFAPFDAEIDAVESVNELLGRSGRRLGGRDGVGYVLRSLPENARHLFRILVAEQMVLAEEGDDSNTGVEYRILYQKAREELVCSTEHQLQTLLKEFYDHQMVESRRDALGTERLLVPFRKDELESLLHDLVE